MKLMFYLFSAVLISYTSLANAALPNLSEQELSLQASHVLTGYIYHVNEYPEVTRKDGKDKIYSAKMLVYNSEKGGFGRNNVIRFFFWKALTRNNGWVGPIGQSTVVDPHKTVRVWLRQDIDGHLHLLEPNGWKIVTYASDSNSNNDTQN